MDWEVEMVIVIGKEGKNIKKENAMDYVAGYSVSHDNGRDWQMKKWWTVAPWKVYGYILPIWTVHCYEG